ncbi:MAG: enoyl-CoA hydratase/isomerase family protein [Acidimicrobiales bacterium]
MSDSSGTVDTTIDDHVGLVLLRRPPHNFLTVPLITNLADHLHDLRGRCRAAVVASDGKSFCAGADFHSDSAPDPTSDNSFGATTAQFYAQALRIFEAPVPLVAAVQGGAIGAGFGLALACDMRVVGSAGWFQVNFVRLGIHPGFAISATLPRLVGTGRASDLLLTARRVDAVESLSIGLCERVVEAGSETDKALEIASEIAAGAPGALTGTRSTLRAGLSEIARSAMEHELREQTVLAGTPDAREGVLAMLERRLPVFGSD